MRAETQAKFDYLAETKSLIKAALIEKGQTVADSDTFRSYADKILAISGGGASADERVKYVTFMYGAQELEKYPVIVGDTVRDRAKDNGWAEDTKLTGWVENPIVPSTDAKIYPVIGWSSADDATSDSDALENVTEDRTVYAVVMEKPRKYAVNFFDDAGKLVKSQRVTYGTSATPPDTYREGYIFNGWALSNGTISTNLVITADIDFYGVWELDQGWIVPMTLPSGITSVYFAKYSPDGKRLFYLYSSKLYMYDTTTQPYTLLNSQSISGVNDLDVSPDGKYVALVNSTKSSYLSTLVSVYSVGDTTLTKQSVISSSAKFSSSDYAWTGSFSADSSKFIVYHASGYFGVFNISATSTWTFTSAQLPNTEKLLHLNFSPDSTKVIALAEGVTTSQTRVYDATNNFANVTSTYISSRSTGPVYDYYGDAIAYSPDGRYLACGYRGNSSGKIALVVLDTSTSPYKAVKTITPTSGMFEVTGVAYNADGSLLAVSRKESPYIEIYDTSTWELKEAPTVLPTAGSICCAFGTNNHLLVGSSASTLYKVVRS
jgi:hypothetical protein